MAIKVQSYHTRLFIKLSYVLQDRMVLILNEWKVSGVQWPAILVNKIRVGDPFKGRLDEMKLIRRKVFLVIDWRIHVVLSPVFWSQRVRYLTHGAIDLLVRSLAPPCILKVLSPSNLRHFGTDFLISDAKILRIYIPSVAGLNAFSRGL